MSEKQATSSQEKDSSDLALEREATFSVLHKFEDTLAGASDLGRAEKKKPHAYWEGPADEYTDWVKLSAKQVDSLKHLGFSRTGDVARIMKAGTYENGVSKFFYTLELGDSSKPDALKEHPIEVPDFGSEERLKGYDIRTHSLNRHLTETGQGILKHRPLDEMNKPATGSFDYVEANSDYLRTIENVLETLAQEFKAADN